MPTFRVLVADPLSDKGVEALALHPDLSVDVNTGLAPDELLKIIGQYDGLVVRSQTKVTLEVLVAATKLKVVGRAGVGVDNIDREAATDHGVVVMNTPSGNTISTAEQAFTLMLSLARKIPQAHASVIAGQWERKKFQGTEIYGKRLAVLGMGRIGTEFAKRAQAFGMTVAAYDPFLSDSRAAELKVDLASNVDAALKGADVVTLHIPLTDETKHVLNDSRLRLMNKGAFVINCARGGLVDEAALANLMSEGHIAGCALDVYEVEPPTLDHPIFAHERTVFTPHLGASTDEAQENVGIQVAEQIRDFLTTGSITNAVNMPNLDAKTISEIGPYLDLATSLGKLASKLAPAQADALRVSYFGPVSEIDNSVISRTVLTNYLAASRNEDQVNLVNATAVAKQVGLNVSEATLATSADFSELVEVTVTKGDKKFRVAGAFVGKQARIVAVDGMGVETGTKGHFLYVKNDDRPGIVGTVGTTLAKHNLNIANMSLSRNKAEGIAINIIELDSPATKGAMEELNAAPGILSTKAIEL